VKVFVTNWVFKDSHQNVLPHFRALSEKDTHS